MGQDKDLTYADSDNDPELMQEMQNIIRETHVSKVAGIAVSLARPDEESDFCIILMLASCCGMNAFEINLDEANGMIVGLTEALKRIPAKGSNNVN